jgi:hypothetical protein
MKIVPIAFSWASQTAQVLHKDSFVWYGIWKNGRNKKGRRKKVGHWILLGAFFVCLFP